MENCRNCQAPPKEFLVAWFTNVPSYACRICGTQDPEHRYKVVYDSSTFQTIQCDSVGRTIPCKIPSDASFSPVL